MRGQPPEGKERVHSTTSISASSASTFVCMQRGAQNAVEIAEGERRWRWWREQNGNEGKHLS